MVLEVGTTVSPPEAEGEEDARNSPSEEAENQSSRVDRLFARACELMATSGTYSTVGTAMIV